ncbi:MAG TPA: TonB-dependent receptor [Rhodocyclaceae bacterium]|nr:TonB-dependent receptor [Rhodocyclaceae bacterium]
MNRQSDFRVKLLVQLVLSTFLVTGADASFAQNADDVARVQVTGAGIDSPESAPYQAPTQGSLIATQPQSIISQHYIEENAAAAANYTDIAQIAPSVWSIDPNGPGMMESQSGGPYLRGFANGQYNVTFDGIPWGDSNDFTQHSTSYFMPQDTGTIVVDRGPGDASNVGNATFGGTMAVSSKNPKADTAITPYTSFGSFNTHLLGAEFDSGQMKNYGDASMFIDYKNFTTDGYLTDAHLRRGNLFVKFVKPVSDNTLLTVVSMQNKLHQNVPQGTTLANLQKYGRNYGLNNDPTSQDYFGYNYDDITSDFEYLGLKSHQGLWKVDNKLYTYAYYHNGYYGADLGGAQPNGTSYGANNVPGFKMYMNYRSYGDLLRLSRAIGQGNLNLGAWVDHQTNSRAEWAVDYTLGGAIDPASGNGGYTRLMNDTLTTLQPYIDYAWRASEALTITPGLKYVSFRRTLDAAVNQKTGLPYNGGQTWTKVLPALTAHYAIEKNWAAYVQLAKGFQAPNLNSFYKVNPDLGTLNPEETMNYQLGTTWASRRLALSADVYQIDFKNKIVSSPSGNGTIFSNAGGATYKGVEGEGTYYVGAGFSLYGNYSLNSAKDKTNNQWLPNTPKTTAAAGVTYNQGSLYASLMAKHIGSRFGDTGETIPLDPYTTVNFSSSYKLKNVAGWAKETKLGFQINNLFDKQDIYSLGTYDANGNPMYFTLPERSYQLSLSVSL